MLTLNARVRRRRGKNDLKKLKWSICLEK